MPLPPRRFDLPRVTSSPDSSALGLVVAPPSSLPEPPALAAAVGSSVSGVARSPSVRLERSTLTLFEERALRAEARDNANDAAVAIGKLRELNPLLRAMEKATEDLAVASLKQKTGADGSSPYEGMGPAEAIPLDRADICTEFSVAFAAVAGMDNRRRILKTARTAGITMHPTNVDQPDNRLVTVDPRTPLARLCHATRRTMACGVQSDIERIERRRYLADLAMQYANYKDSTSD
ncbi:MAG: hypothetical protein M1826_000644 [Phylliscum demangeonii]|nr:MAG: hypothetical protein M1826_000644 [Phylliscum demangeonii]